MRISPQNGAELARIGGTLKAKSNGYETMSKIQEPHNDKAKVSAGEVYQEHLGFKDFILDEAAKMARLLDRLIDVIKNAAFVKDLTIAANPDAEIARIENKSPDDLAKTAGAVT